MTAFLPRLAVAFPPGTWQDVTILVAVSGGADSVALLRGLVQLKRKVGDGRIIAAHFNHRLRGEESDADETFVRQLARDLNIRLEVGRSNARSDSTGDGIEAAARAARYSFLTETAHRIGARYVVTAHTADDQVETVLHRIIRGTGIGGLAGIPRVRELSTATALARPLLAITRAEVLAFLTALPQPFREDSSNASRAHTRNRIRHGLLPLLESEYAPALRASLLRLSKLAEDNQAYLAAELEPLLSAHVHKRGNTIILDCLPLAPLHRHLLRELCLRIWTIHHWPQQDMTLEKWDQLATLVQQPAPIAPQCLPSGIRAERIGDELWLSRLTPDT
ncbi:MAG: tRNA lysidine(34) synthetase TilS [Pirellulaceae bacterium]|nr:tRNA lysidine(34) synthetase TilS [Pirellulaceae bacterium]